MMSLRRMVENLPLSSLTVMISRLKSLIDFTVPLGKMRTYLSSILTLPASSGSFWPETTAFIISGVMPRFAIFARDISNATISCWSPRRSIFETSAQRSSSRLSSFACSFSSA